MATWVLHYASMQEPPTSEEEDNLEDEVRARGPVKGTTTNAPIDIDSPNMYEPSVRWGSSSGITHLQARESIWGSILQN